MHCRSADMVLHLPRGAAGETSSTIQSDQKHGDDVPITSLATACTDPASPIIFFNVRHLLSSSSTSSQTHLQHPSSQSSSSKSAYTHLQIASNGGGSNIQQ
ncbi:hypothetical protein ACLOJK_035108 [Asimina triloba]